MASPLRRIEQCNDCGRYGEYCPAFTFAPKACIDFKAFSYWKPKTVRNLFIAEAPPWTAPRYFYNANIPAGTLRKGLFRQLGIEDYTEKGLEKFCEQSFLIDTVKCRFRKDNKPFPSEIIENCVSRFLREEIDSIHLKNIVLLGDTARRGLAQLSGFEALSMLRVKRDCGSVIEAEGYRVILYAYPSLRNTYLTKHHPLLELLWCVQTRCKNGEARQVPAFT